MSSRSRRSRSRSRERDDYDGHYAPARSSDAPPPMANVNAYGMAPPLTTGGMPSSILQAQQSAQEKINRELFVGNTPPGTSEMLLMQFMNGAMRRVHLCGPQETPILNCRVNQKFAFIECLNSETANKALNLNGIPFLGAVLKVSRPSKYAGPHVPAKTWQELTGQPLPANAILDASADEKIHRELFVGNTTPEMTAEMLQEFLGNSMLQVGLNVLPGNPVSACRVSGKFAFIELRTPQEAANALNLNNIPYMGAQLRVGRPSKWTGQDTPHGNWEDILAKYVLCILCVFCVVDWMIVTHMIFYTFSVVINRYMSGELKLPSQGGAGAAAIVPTAAPIPQQMPTKVVELKNMLSPQDLENEEEYQDIMEDTKEECSQFGALKSVIIPKKGEVGATKIFLEYMTTDDAAKAIQGLAGRTFDGRKVTAMYFDETKFANQDYS